VRWLVFLLLLAWPVAVLAQQPDLSKDSLATRGLILALQQVGVAAEQYIGDVRAQLAARDARIAELEKLCSDACKK